MRMLFGSVYRHLAKWMISDADTNGWQLKWLRPIQKEVQSNQGLEESVLENTQLASSR